MKTHDVKQGTPEWFALRMGIPTASEFDSLITPLWKARTGDGVQTYLYQKLCERMIGAAADAFAGSFAMNNGVVLEMEARPYYAFTREVDVQTVGFCTTDDGAIGCSPDGLVGTDGGLEIKCPEPATHLKYLLEGEVPKQYLAQVHGSMLVTGRAWWDFMSYSRQFPPLVVRVNRDEAIQKALRESLDAFLGKFHAALAKLTELKAASAPRTKDEGDW